MKSRPSNEVIVGSHWYPFSGYNEGEPPTTTREWTRSFSDDLVLSSNHHVSLLGEGNLDIGGPFEVHRRYYTEYSTLGKQSVLDFSKEWGAPDGSGWRGHYRYPQVAYTPQFNNATFPDPVLLGSSSTELDQYGTEAVSIVAPTKPEYDLSTAIGELFSDGIPSATGLNDLSSRHRTLVERAVLT